ncbi:MAG: AAA family ATPase [Thermoguttaceae bacterium]|nr:AAA family ATPase [Thermoguttaceae bacterium]
MYADYWGMECTPFASRYAPRFFVATPDYEEVAARIRYLLEQNTRAGLLLGASGTGKTWCIASQLAELRADGVVAASISLDGLNHDAFFPEVANVLGWDAEQGDSNRFGEILRDHFAESAYFGRTTVLVLEDADRASEATLRRVQRLFHLEADTPLRLTLLLTARPRRMERLCDFLEYCPLTMELGVWSADTVSMVVSQLLASVGVGRNLFTEDAIACMLEETNGNPRQWIRLADLSLAAAASTELRWVDAETVRWVLSKFPNPFALVT